MGTNHMMDGMGGMMWGAGRPAIERWSSSRSVRSQVFDQHSRREDEDDNQQEPNQPRAPHQPAHPIHHVKGTPQTVRCIASRCATAQASRIGCFGSGRDRRVCPRRRFPGFRLRLARTRLMISAHHAQTERAHNQTGCRRHDQRCDSNSGQPIPTERETGGRDSEPGDRKDTAIPHPGSVHACPIMCR